MYLLASPFDHHESAQEEEPPLLAIPLSPKHQTWRTRGFHQRSTHVRIYPQQECIWKKGTPVRALEWGCKYPCGKASGRRVWNLILKSKRCRGTGINTQARFDAQIFDVIVSVENLLLLYTKTIQLGIPLMMLKLVDCPSYNNFKEILHSVYSQQYHLQSSILTSTVLLSTPYCLQSIAG
jgi:hypothetical protein